ncbi:MAG: lipoprotein [Betaproteobacteria bacterium]|nr:lipoprotein [Betaproteobacteria bacterium]
MQTRGILGTRFARARTAGLLAALLAASALMAGCGQKGPLYLPKPPQATPAQG